MAWRSAMSAARRLGATGAAGSTFGLLARTSCRHQSVASPVASLVQNATVSAGCAHRSACLPSLSVLAVSMLQQASPARGLSNAAPAVTQPSMSIHSTEGTINSAGAHMLAAADADADDDEGVPTRRKKKRLRIQQPLSCPPDTSGSSNKHMHGVAHAADSSLQHDKEPDDAAGHAAWARVGHTVHSESAPGLTPGGQQKGGGYKKKTDNLTSVYILSSAERLQPEISQAEKKYLARKGHQLQHEKRMPRIKLGAKGITRAWLSGVGDMLERHELVNVEVPNRIGYDAREDVAFVGCILEATQDCIVVDTTGRKFTVYRDSSLPRSAASIWPALTQPTLLSLAARRQGHKIALPA